MARQASTVSWQVKALVEATPISGPASVGSTTSRLARDGRRTHVDDRGDALALRLAVAQRRQRVGRLARLRHEQGEPALGQRRLAVAELGGDVDVDRNARVALDPVLADQARVVGRAAGRDRHLRERAGSMPEIGHHHATFREIDEVGQRVADHLRLLVDLLGHEVAVVALVDQQRGGDRRGARAVAPRGRRGRRWSASRGVSTAQSPSSR